MDGAEIINQAVESSLELIEREREKEIIARRFGLLGQKETLEQIGEMLNVTRERVRQLEKAILIRLKIATSDHKIPNLPAAEKLIIRYLSESGRVARVDNLAKKILGHNPNKTEKAQINFLATISNSLVAISENDNYYNAIAIAEYGDSREITKKVNELTKIISENKKPMTLEELDAQLDYEHPSYIAAIASISKKLATLNGLWGLTKWPSVNPKNIRDKIYVILEENKEPIHFSKIAEAIKESNFKRKNVTTQAIHNELIKDPRFILIGRGIYALDSWGYKKGTVADIITNILSKAGNEGLSKEEIVKQVLKERKVKETTVLLNLQNKKEFIRIDKDHYRLA